jgi:uncharacterized protein DUF5684
MTISALLVQDQTNGAGAALGGGVLAIVMLAVAAVFIIGLWKVFTKAGQPGWAAIIPFYNAYIVIKIAGRPGWWLLMLLIPVVNVVFCFLLAIDIAKAFGQSAVFGVVLLFLLGGIGYLVLGFGNYSYVGTSGMAPAVA